MLTVACVGKIREPWLKEGIAMYEKRISRFDRISVIEAPKGVGAADESKALLSIIPGSPYVAAFDSRGRQMPSTAFAEWLNKIQASVNSHVCFLIGGADGLSGEARGKAQEVISLSLATFPHQLFRLIALEQIYRALSITSGLPYHKE